MNTHLKEVKLISFISGECGITEHNNIQSHLNECEACRTLCKDLNSIINIAKKIPTPQTSKDVCNTIRNYADRKFPKQEKFKESFSKLFLSLFSHRLVYAVSLIVIIVIIVTSMIFLNPGKRDQNVLLLNDVQFDAAIVMLQEEIDEYLSEFEEDAFTYLDEDILDLEKKMDDFDKEHEEYNYLF